VIVPSESARQDLNAVLRPPGRRVHVVYEGVDACFRPVDPAASAAAAARYGLPGDYALSLGSREPGKNRATLLRALALLVENGRDLHLAVVGQPAWGTEEEDQLIDRLGLEARVHVLGYVPQADLPALYSGASVFVFPSLHEGFGLPALEALACGAPVVASNVSALPEVVGDAGLLVDPADEGAIAAGVAAVLDDPSLAERLRRAGPQRAARFTWDACAEGTLAVFRRVLDAR
jgi:alpha-1,3-rhamnosyl/mannosyltransferase